MTKSSTNPLANSPTILSLDLGTKTGWALYIRTATNIVSGTVHFQPRRSEGMGVRYLKFANWLEGMLIRIGKIDFVYFELVCGHDGTYAAHVYGGLMGQVTALCERYRIPYRGIHVGTIKKFISGKGNATKEEVISSVKTLGHDPEDDNEADALALLYFAMQQCRHGRISTDNRMDNKTLFNDNSTT